MSTRGTGRPRGRPRGSRGPRGRGRNPTGGSRNQGTSSGNQNISPLPNVVIQPAASTSTSMTRTAPTPTGQQGRTPLFGVGTPVSKCVLVAEIETKDDNPRKYAIPIYISTAQNYDTISSEATATRLEMKIIALSQGEINLLNEDGREIVPINSKKAVYEDDYGNEDTIDLEF